MQIIKDAITQVVKELGLVEARFAVEHPKDETHGDYSSNVAMVVGKKIGQNPRELAEKIVTKLQNDIELASLVQSEKIEVAGPGFINFTLKQEYLRDCLQVAVKSGYGKSDSLKGKKVVVEYTDPNPFKEFHIGHLMSNAIGEAIARLVEVQGAKVTRANYQGDIGLHVAKSVWGMRKKMEQEGENLTNLEEKPIKERQQFMGQAYALGATAYENDPTSPKATLGAREEMQSLNEKIYAGADVQVMKLYRTGREWSLAYFETIYQRLGTKYDEYYFESETGTVGLKVVEEGLKKEVLEVGEEGAVVYKGEKDGLHTRVFRNKLGLPTYEAKDLGLAKTKFEREPYDLSLIITANEIDEYFRVVLKVMAQLYPDLAKKTVHLSHGIMKLVTGKMSSRTGKVVTGEGLLDELKQVVLTKMGTREIEDKELVADQIAVGALKWTVLKQEVGGDIVYEPLKMTNLEGDTGPYVQYTHARAKSVLAKAKTEVSGNKYQVSKMSKGELAIVRWLARYPEVIMEAGKRYAPHLVANYLYNLATRFNTFYNKHQILTGTKEEGGRLLLTGAVAQVLKQGLNLLGIIAPEKM